MDSLMEVWQCQLRALPVSDSARACRKPDPFTTIAGTPLLVHGVRTTPSLALTNVRCTH